MGKLLLAISILVHSISFSQSKNDIYFIMDDTSQKFLGTSNINFYINIKGLGDYKLNTGPYGKTSFLGNFPEVTLPNKVEMFLGPQKMSSSDSYQLLVNKYNNGYDYKFDWTPDYNEVEYPNSIKFKEIDELGFISDKIDIDQIAKTLRDDDKTNLFIYGCFCEDSTSKSIHAIYDRYELVKKEILEIYNCDHDRIDFEAQDVDCKFLPSLDLGYSIERIGKTETYSHPYQITCELTYEHLEFEPFQIILIQETLGLLAPIPTFLFENPSLGIELRFWKAENVNSDLNEKRFEFICQEMEKAGIDRKHFLFKSFDYPTRNYIDSLVKVGESPPMENQVSMYIKEDFNFVPCGSNGFQKINFLNNTTVIKETECDSLRHLVRFITSNPNNEFKITALIKKDQDKNLAIQRAQLVKDKLINLGINKHILLIQSQQEIYLSEDIDKKKEKYPSWYDYEIGVYLEIVEK